MENGKKSKETNSRILPLIAGILVVAALIIVFVVPKNSGSQKNETGSANENAPARESNEEAVPAAPDAVSEINGDGKLVIHADRLSSDQVSFIKVSENSRIELLARADDNGTAKAALGTCQSCNGSPNAFYTQEGDELKCNNCGLTFPISVLDTPGGGCHPIMLDEALLTYEGNDLLIDTEGLSEYEPLFSKVADH